jgi:hypothetical protein
MRLLPTIAFLAAIIAVVVVIVLAGWAGDKATPGSRGRVQVAPAKTQP